MELWGTPIEMEVCSGNSDVDHSPYMMLTLEFPNSIEAFGYQMIDSDQVRITPTIVISYLKYNVSTANKGRTWRGFSIIAGMEACP